MNMIGAEMAASMLARSKSKDTRLKVKLAEKKQIELSEVEEDSPFQCYENSHNKPLYL